MQSSANLEYVKGTSNKFWTITQDGNTVIRTWGRKGTKGQGKTDTFDNEYLAAADYTRRLREQLRDGYLQVESVTADPSTTLTKVDGKRTWVWTIRQDGHKLYIAHGTEGGTASRQTIRTADKDAASAEYKRRLSEKLSNGYQSVKADEEPSEAGDSDSDSKTDTVVNPAGKKVKRLVGERVVVIKVDYYAFERFVADITGHEFSFVSDQECGNDSDHELHADGDLSEYDVEQVEEFIASGSGSYLSRDLLNYFVSKGWLEAGTYLISVCW